MYPWRVLGDLELQVRAFVRIYTTCCYCYLNNLFIALWSALTVFCIISILISFKGFSYRCSSWMHMNINVPYINASQLIYLMTKFTLICEIGKYTLRYCSSTMVVYTHKCASLQPTCVCSNKVSWKWLRKLVFCVQYACNWIT